MTPGCIRIGVVGDGAVVGSLVHHRIDHGLDYIYYLWCSICFDTTAIGRREQTQDLAGNTFTLR